MRNVFKVVLICIIGLSMAIGAETKEESLDSLNKKTYVLLKAKKYLEAKNLIEKSLKKTIDKYGPDSFRAANEYLNLANVFLYMDEYKEALDNNLKALEICKKSSDEDCMKKLGPDLNLSIGLCYGALKEYSKAMPYLRDSVVARLPEDKKKGELPNDYVIALLAKAYKASITQGNYKNAEICMRSIFYIIDNNIDLKEDQSMNRVTFTLWLAIVLQVQDNLKEAEAKLDEYADLVDANEKIPADKKYSAHLGNGDAYIQMGKYSKAEESYNRALKYTKGDDAAKKGLLKHLELQKKKYADAGETTKVRKIDSVMENVESEQGVELTKVDLAEDEEAKKIIRKELKFEEIAIFDHLPERKEMLSSASSAAKDAAAVVAIPYDLKDPKDAKDTIFGKMDPNSRFLENIYNKKIEFLKNDFDRSLPLGAQFGYLIRKDALGRNEMLPFKENGYLDNALMSWSGKDKAKAKMYLKSFTAEYEKFDGLKRNDYISYDTLYPEDISLKMSGMVTDILRSRGYGQIIDLTQHRGAFRGKKIKEIVEDIGRKYGVKYVAIFLFEPNSKWTMRPSDDGHVYPEGYMVTDIGLRLVFAFMIYEANTGEQVFGEYSMESARSVFEGVPDVIVFYTEEIDKNKNTAYKDGILEKDRLIELLKLRLYGKAPRAYFVNNPPLKELVPSAKEL